MVLNVAAYHFAPVEAPAALAARLRAHAADAGLRGTVLVAPEGVNLFLAGAEAAVRAHVELVRAEPGFGDLRAKYSRSATPPFARLKVKVKREIIAFRRENASPLAGRAPEVAPETLARWLAQGRDDAGRRLVLLDTRNREEVAYGTFAGALTLPIDNFTDLPEALAPHRESLTDATVVSFCTGGIRCEKAALWMRATGMENVLQLDGGILGYFERVGGQGYDGACFVFDERVALGPDLAPAAAPTAG
ncbi:sulfurtransferase [Coralloluteibacterium thermophilus]|uniref:Sulfurtransferase n=1 Tax=Coralloluteibacterium thermophilum TaxID=2707049 RepID=A0ABV9NKD4_9GAMM